MPIRFHQRVFNGLLHLFGSLGGLLCLHLQCLLGLHRVIHLHGLGQLRELVLAQRRQWRGLDLPSPVIRGQQHVRHPRTGRIHIGAGDVQEHHRARRLLLALSLIAQHSLRFAAVEHVGRLESPVGIVNALVVLFVFRPLLLDARACASRNSLTPLGQQALPQHLSVVKIRRVVVVGLQAPLVEGCLHINTQSLGLKGPSFQSWDGLVLAW